MEDEQTNRTKSASEDSFYIKELKQGNNHLSGLQGCDHPCEHRPAQFLYRR